MTTTESHPELMPMDEREFNRRYLPLPCNQLACTRDAGWWCRACQADLCRNCAEHVHPATCIGEGSNE